MSVPLQRSAAVVALLGLFVLPPCLSFGQTIFYEVVPKFLGFPESSDVLRVGGLAFRGGFWLLSLVGAGAAALGVGSHVLATPVRAVAGGWVLLRTVGFVLGIVYTLSRLDGAPLPLEGDPMVLVRAGTSALSALFEVGLMGLLIAWLVGGRPVWMAVVAGMAAVGIGLSSLFWTGLSLVDAFTRWAGGSTSGGWIGTVYSSEALTFGSTGLDLCLGFTLAMVLSGAVAMWPREDGGAAGAR